MLDANNALQDRDFLALIARLHICSQVQEDPTHPQALLVQQYVLPKLHPYFSQE